MEELVKYIVKNLVEDKEAVNVTSREEEKAVVVEVTLTREPMELIAINNYTLNIHFDPVYPQA